jgi:hypothetical protein
MQPAHSVIDFSAADHGALSQNALEHLEDLCPAHRSSLDQADHHLHILQHPRVPRGRTAVLRDRDARRASRGAIAVRFGPAALAVEGALLLLADRIAVIGDTAPSGLLLAMSAPAAKGTTQVFATGITRMSEEKDPAIPAPRQASSQQGLGSENRSQQHVILQNQSDHPLRSIPLRRTLEILRDLNCKKPRLSLKVLTYWKTPSSYPTGNRLSR